MNKLYILCGFPFAGKSTVAKILKEKLGFTRIEMKKFYNSSDNKIDWEKTYDTYDAQLKQNLKEGKNIIVDTVGYNKKGREDLRKLTKEYNFQPYVIYIKTPLDIVKQRWIQNKQTNERHDVSEKEFDDIVNNFEVPTQEENVIVITPDINAEKILNLFK